MSIMTSRRTTALPKLNFTEIENVTDGCGLLTDRGTYRGGGKRESLPQVTPRFHEHTLGNKGGGRISVITITPRSSDSSSGSSDSLNDWTPEHSPKAQLVEIDFRSHRIQKKGAQISMLDLQSMVTPRNTISNQRKKVHNEFKKPARPSFLPPLDMSNLNSTNVSPESTPQTPRFLEEHPLDHDDDTPRQVVIDHQSRKMPGHISLAMNHETPRVDGASRHVDMQHLFHSGKGNNINSKKPVKKYGASENFNTPREGNSTERGIRRLPTVQKMKQNVKVNGLDVVTPRDIGNLTLSDTDSEEDEESQQMRAPVRDNFKVLHDRDKMPSILNKGGARDRSNSKGNKLINRKTENKKVLRFNVETDRMQGQHNDYAFYDENLPHVNDEHCESNSTLEFRNSRPSTVNTEANGWFPNDDSRWEGHEQENDVERWWDGKQRK